MSAPHNGTQTSREAAQSIEHTITDSEMVILRHLRSLGQDGATDDEMERALGMPHQTVSARRNGLASRDMVLDSGERRLTRSGRRAIVWVARTQPFSQEELVEIAAREARKACRARITVLTRRLTHAQLESVEAHINDLLIGGGE